MRGFVNAHTHLYSGLAPFGMPPPAVEPACLLDVLQRVWWRLDRAIDERALGAAARFYVADALLKGTCCVVDHHESPHFIEGSLDVLAAACDELGMAAVLCYGATERNGGREEARRGLGECRRFITANRRPLVRGVIGLHASFTVSDDTIREAGALCRELDTVLHVHLAEDAADVEDARRRGYEGPLERLIALDALPPGSMLAHGVHLTAGQVRKAEGAGCWLVQNPRSNAGNRVGYPRALRHARRVALGTDGFASDMRAEHEALVAEGMQAGEARDVLDDRLRRGRAMAAALLPDGGWLAESGPDEDLATGAHGRVQRLVVGGRVAVDEGRLTGGDWDAIRAEARAEAPRLWKRMRDTEG